MSGDVKKLPQWAQAMIAQLARERDEWRTLAESDAETHKGSGIYVESYIGRGFLRQYLPARAAVTFVLGVDGRGERKVRVCVREREACLSLNGDDALIIHPRASNDFDVSAR